MIATQTYLQYALMAEVFKYPSADTKARIPEVLSVLKEDYPEAALAIERYSAWIRDTDQWEIEEVYAKTFHVQATCYLDLGYVIFGEDYKRGEFLVNMKREQVEAGNDCGPELPDNLANVLTLLPRLKDAELRDELAGQVMMPALRMMLKEFGEQRMRIRTSMLKKKHNALILEDQRNGNIYKDAIEALLLMLTNDFEEVALHQVQPQTDPLRAAAPVSDCGTCNITHIPVKTMKS
jgi:nitrate reductase assembly molybdenum cofactor insertion protein NarJ